jgi:hypothetical protein
VLRKSTSLASVAVPLLAMAGFVIGGSRPIPATGETASSPNHPTNYLLVRGVDAVDGNLIANDLTAGFPRQSADWGATWSGNKGLPPNTSTFGKVVRFKGNLYVMSKDASTGRFGVYRTPPAAGNTMYSWSSALVTLAPGASSLNTTMNADDSYLYLGEYGDPQGGPRILRSADGVDWEVVFGPDASLRHIHAVAPDPYNPGDVWATTGDGGGKAVMRSTSFGAPGSWQVVVSSSYWQAVQISFSPEWVFFAGDSGTGTVWVLDRQHLQPTWAATNYHATMPVPGGSAGDAFYRNAFYGSVDPATGVYYASTAVDTSGANTKGLFALPAVGGELQFLDFNAAGTEVFIAGGRVWSGPYNYPLLPAPQPSLSQKSVTLMLRKHLVARGVVSASDGFTACVIDVPVKIQRRVSGNWKTVGSTTTTATGSYKKRIPDKPGKYRAKAPKVTLNEGADICPAATSPVRANN